LSISVKLPQSEKQNNTMFSTLFETKQH